MRVSANTLKRIAGTVWLLVGLGLSITGLRFVFGRHDRGENYTPIWIAIALALGGLIGILKGRYVLSVTARRNIKRIRALRDPRIWQVFTGTFALVILGMIGLGRWLRTLAENGWLGGYLGVGGLYFGIGSGLVVASWAYFAPPVPARPTRIDASPQARRSKSGLLLVNLGSPSAPTRRAVRVFLRQFLSDPRVVEVNRLLWAFVLNVIILPFRSGQSAKLYRSIWTEEGSPLLIYGKQVRDRLAEKLGREQVVALGMRYGEPSLAGALDELIAQDCRQILVLPLFPQFSNTTTGSIIAEVNRIARKRRHPPDLRFVDAFYDDPGYIEALAQLAEASARGDFTVFSFHGIPESYVERGDPYLDHCGRTAWLLAERLGLERSEWEMVFQSQFGNEPWLQPYLHEYVPALAATKPRVRVIAPSFAADCLETLEEISIRLRDDFILWGGEELIVVPALNADERWIDALEALVRHQTSRTVAASVPLD